MLKKKTSTDEKSQRERFEEAACELGADESLERFNEALGKVARHRPAKPSAETFSEKSPAAPARAHQPDDDCP